MDKIKNSTSVDGVISEMVSILSWRENVDESMITQLLREKYPELSLPDQKLISLELDNKIKSDKILKLNDEVNYLSQQIIVWKTYKNISNIDNLTWLPNYAAFHYYDNNDRLELGSPDTVVCLHIQNIWDINTFYWPRVWDHVIQKISHMLNKYANESVDNTIKVYKCDGANFIITYLNPISQNDLNTAFNKVNKLSIRYCDPQWDNPEDVEIIEITILAWASQNWNTKYEKYANAKNALRQSEISHEFVISDIDQEYQVQKIKKSVEVKKLVNWAFLNDGFEVFAQEIKNIAYAHSIIKEYECLIRLKNPNYNKEDPTKWPQYFSPAFFLDTIDESGLNKKLTNLVVSKVIDFMKTSKHSFSINITHNDLEDPEFVSRIFKYCQDANIDPHRITFEVLETIDLDKNPLILQSIEALYLAGFQLAIDDFGSWVANFSHLLRFRPKKLKIDKKFLTHIAYHTHTISHKVANLIRPIFGLSQSEPTIEQQQWNLQYTSYKAFTLLARNNNIQVVAEWVETKEQEDVLHLLNVNLTQWYLNGHPKPLKEI